jgi:hypothetical protein
MVSIIRRNTLVDILIGTRFYKIHYQHLHGKCAVLTLISGSSLLLGRSYINLGLDGPLKASGSAFELLAVDLAVSHSGLFVVGGNPRICSGL